MSCQPWPQTRSITREKIVFHQPFKFNVHLRVTRECMHACTCVCTLYVPCHWFQLPWQKTNSTESPRFNMYIVPSISELFSLNPLTTSFYTPQVNRNLNIFWTFGFIQLHVDMFLYCLYRVCVYASARLCVLSSNIALTLEKWTNLLSLRQDLNVLSLLTKPSISLSKSLKRKSNSIQSKWVLRYLTLCQC